MSGDSEPESAGTSTPEPGFTELLEMLRATYGFDFREYKEGSLARRIRARLSQVHVKDFFAYTKYLTDNPGEHIALFNTILINVTGFFRDPEAWKILAEDVIPRVVDGAQESRSIRIWSAGCSSGEEPFSVAMLLAEHLGDRASEYLIKVYGTDIDEDALATARHGLYRLEQLKDVPVGLVDRYFARDGQLYRLRRDIRRWCIFGAHNLTQAPPLSHIDLLLCRNVLIYFTSDLQERILARFHYALRENGDLFLGRSESLLARSRLFTARHLKWRVFQRLPTMSRQVTAVLPEPDPRAPGLAGDHSQRADVHTAVNRAQRAVEAIPAAVMVIDMTDTVLTWNAAAEQMFDIPIANALARRFRELDVSYRVEGLRARIEDVKARHTAARIEQSAFARRDGTPVHADISIMPLRDGPRQLGVLVFAVEATEHARLREEMTRVAEQHATAIEELQSTNEELETTNEELQSTNEELEATNEELQSTNEELETTIEELHAANTELATLNTELEARTGELNRIDGQYKGIVDSFEHGMVVLDRPGTVKTWNRAAELMWRVPRERALEQDFFTLPIPGIGSMPRNTLEAIWSGSLAQTLHGLSYATPTGHSGQAVLRLTPIVDAAGSVSSVLGVLSPVDHTGTSAPPSG